MSSLRLLGLENNDIWCRRVLIRFDCGDQPAHLNTQMRSGHAPIFTGRLDRGGDLDGFAESLHRDAWRRRDALIAAGNLGSRSFQLERLGWLNSSYDGIISQVR